LFDEERDRYRGLKTTEQPIFDVNMVIGFFLLKAVAFYFWLYSAISSHFLSFLAHVASFNRNTDEKQVLL
jgi:hypothetical protein